MVVTRVDQAAPLRILQLCNLFDPVVGGLERNVASTSEELARRGHDVTVATLQIPGTPREELRDGIRIVRLHRAADPIVRRLGVDPGKPFHATFVDPLVVKQLERLVSEGSFDVVHTHDWLVHSFFPVQRRHPGIPHVHTAHDYGLVCPKKTLVYTGRGHEGSYCSGPGLRKCLGCAPDQYGAAKGAILTIGRQLGARWHRQIDVLLVLSEWMVKALSGDSAGERNGGALVIPTFVPNDTEGLAHSASLPRWLPARYILFVGALGEHKGLRVLFDAYRILRADEVRVGKIPSLVCIGTPRADTPPAPGGVLIRHNVPHAETMAAWARAELAVVPSVWAEPFGQVAIEAMLAGTPVIASAIGGLLDIVHDEKTGLLVQPGDAAALATAIGRLLDDTELAEALAVRARLRAREFTAGQVVGRLEQIYWDLVAANA
jgi:glycosyltransferase involved in cell wall biosynthesis